MLIDGNCGFILAFYVSRLSLRSKFNHSYVHCQFAFTTCLPISLSSFPDRSISKLPHTAWHGLIVFIICSCSNNIINMAKNNNNNSKNNDKDNNERQRQVREERERRRREAEEGASATAAAPALGTQRLFAQPRRATNAAVDVNVDELFVSSAADAASSAPPAHPIFSPGQVEAALAMATATPLPDDDDDDLLRSDDTDKVDVSDGVLSDVGEDVMDVDDGIEATASEVRGSVTLRVRVDPKPDEVVVENIREWTPALLKDGTAPVSVRDIGIQADFGGASIARHQKYLRASRGRQKKKRLAKKRAMESEETPRPNPDTAASPPPILRQSGVSNPTSLPAPVAPVADNSRDRVTAPPAKARKTETPTKKKEPWYQSRKDERKKRQALRRSLSRQKPALGWRRLQGGRSS